MCDCIEAVNYKLALHNSKLLVHETASSKRVVVFAQKTTYKPLGVVPLHIPAVYCPFCGQKYEIEHEDTVEKEVERRR